MFYWSLFLLNRKNPSRIYSTGSGKQLVNPQSSIACSFDKQPDVLVIAQLNDKCIMKAQTERLEKKGV